MEKEFDYEDEELLEEYIILDYEDYQEFNEEQDDVYKNLFVNKLIKNDSIKFY
ncbi:hypothetical protein ACWOAH_01540 [Vagococcus vulneris]|uniref:hypothetical protein n=1 Tax=Vagococcus vulneris TaxID=1977869 RepID=UPI001402ECAF|nr:hypothetical protein [Vagococcus vulneris]